MRLDAASRHVVQDGRVPSLGTADRAALALLLALRPSLPGARLLAVTAGSAECEPLLREALAHGADEALRIAPAATPGGMEESAAVTRANADAVAQALRPRAPALVATGDASNDTAHGCFGAFLAHALETAFAHRVTSAALIGGWWRVEVKLERGYRQRLELRGPAVITVSPHAAALPEPSLPAWLHSRTARIAVVSPPTGSGAGTPLSTALRLPVPRVKRHGVPSPSPNAEDRIRALVATPAGAGGTLLPASDGPERHADAILDWLRVRGYR